MGNAVVAAPENDGEQKMVDAVYAPEREDDADLARAPPTKRVRGVRDEALAASAQSVVIPLTPASSDDAEEAPLAPAVRRGVKARGRCEHGKKRADCLACSPERACAHGKRRHIVCVFAAARVRARPAEV